MEKIWGVEDAAGYVRYACGYENYSALLISAVGSIDIEGSVVYALCTEEGDEDGGACAWGTVPYCTEDSIHT